jgi:phenylacetyl-CoA:acceptor oxidoreductase subunit 1
MTRLGMVIDLKKCTGCYACSIACKASNNTPPGATWARVLKRETGEDAPGERAVLPVLCMHCANPPCVKVCPAGATFKMKDGVVVVDSDKCVGCRYCMMACPYGARYFQPTKEYYYDEATPNATAGIKSHPAGVVSKCDLCSERVKGGQEPACVEACPTNARIYGDWHDPNGKLQEAVKDRQSEQLRPELGTDPSVRYLR